MSKVKTTKKAVNPLLEDEEVVVEEEQVEEVEEKAPAKSKKKVDIASEFLSDIEATKRKLLAQEQVHFMVPLAEGEKPGAIESVTICGYRTEVQKGLMVVIPKDVAEQLANKYQIGMNAGSDFRVDLNSQKRDALQG